MDREDTHAVTLIIQEDQAGQRVDQAVTQLLQDSDATRARVQAWIKQGRLSIDGLACMRPARRMVLGETMRLEVPRTGTQLTPEAGCLGIVFQDEAMAVLNKPAGLSVHPAPGLDTGTLAHRLVHHFPALRQLDGHRPGIVHRLDKDTTGLMAVALNESVRQRLTEDFAARRVHKTYLALVFGRPSKNAGSIDAAIGRHPSLKTRMAVVAKGGKEALSDYTVLWADPKSRFSLLAVRIHTGRTHQIRVHLRHIGHPLLGDAAYSTPGAAVLRRDLPWADKLLQRPLLHAWRLVLTHPLSGKTMRFSLSPPKDFLRVMLVCSRQVQRVGLTGLPGCGKSVLLQNLADLGLPVWSADAAVREQYAPGRDGWELLRRRFGTRFVPHDAAPVDARALLAAMRDSPALRKEVEAMIHPLAAHDLAAFWRNHAAGRAAVAEVPLLLESGWQGDVDLRVGLFCPDALRRRWMEASRGWDPRIQADVESWQWPGPDKLRACDLIVDNPGTPEGIQRRAAALARVLRSLRQSQAHALHSRLQTIFRQES